WRGNNFGGLAVFLNSSLGLPGSVVVSLHRALRAPRASVSSAAPGAKTMKQMRTERLTILALGFCGVACLGVAGCSATDSTELTTLANETTTGSIELALRLANGHTVNTASYTITGPNGFTKSAALDVSRSNGISTLIGGLPAGSGYSITISAS